MVNSFPNALSRKLLKNLNPYFLNFVLFCGQSNHIHAGALHFIKESETKKDDDYAYHHADTDLPEVNCSLSHEGETESFDDKDHGIQGKKPAKILGHRT